MRNKIYLINGSEPHFRGKFSRAVQDLEIEHQYVDLKECMFHVHDGELYFYENNNMVDPKSGYFFIREKETDSYFCYLLTEFLHQQGAPFSDPSNQSHTRSDSKSSQLLKLTKHGVPFPESFICRPYSFTLHSDFICERLGYPFVVKRGGARGEAVWLINNEAELEAKFEEAPFQVHLLQKYIPNEYDLRVFVFEDQILGAMKRASVDGFANTAVDASFETVEISEEEKNLAVLASQKAGVDFAGVDIVRTESGPMIWEVNKTPQVERFIPATGVNVVEIMLKMIKTGYLDT
jgi:ribosomal protein S6--L-glutamate ligase